MKCKNCGNALPNEGITCKFCGALMDQSQINYQNKMNDKNNKKIIVRVHHGDTVINKEI